MRAVAGTQVDLREIEWRELALAAHWADLHDEHTLGLRGSGAGGMERAVRLGGDGTPLVAEFACAELAVADGHRPGRGGAPDAGRAGPAAPAPAALGGAR